jgi:hypothetical protein
MERGHSGFTSGDLRVIKKANEREICSKHETQLVATTATICGRFERYLKLIAFFLKKKLVFRIRKIKAVVCRILTYPHSFPWFLIILTSCINVLYLLQLIN